MGFLLGLNEFSLQTPVSGSHCFKDSKFQMDYPPWSKCEALRLGVHLILLYFIRILVVGTEIIFFIWMVDGGWCPTFLVLEIS